MPESFINVNGDDVQVLQILALTTFISLLPSILVMMSSFTRFIIVFAFLRTALGSQQNPPNVVLIGIALFLSLFTMSPVIAEINEMAYEPFLAEELSQEEFLAQAQIPVKDFMTRQTQVSSLNLFCDLAGVPTPQTDEEIMALPLHILVPSFMTSELSRAFEIGFLLFIPFLLIDVIIASVLMSMGMIMLPPSMISMPFKLLLFIALNGWELLFTSLVQDFR